MKKKAAHSPKIGFLELVRHRRQTKMNNILEHALEFASHITHPVTILAFAIVLAVILLVTDLRAKRRTVTLFLAAMIILVMGIAPPALHAPAAKKGTDEAADSTPCLIIRHASAAQQFLVSRANWRCVEGDW